MIFDISEACLLLLTIDADLNEMPHFATFHLGLNCCQSTLLRSYQNVG